MERAATIASSLEAKQDSGNINRTQSMTTLNEHLPQGTGSGSVPRCQVTILGGAEAQTRFEDASKQSNDPPLSRVNTLGSGEDYRIYGLRELSTQHGCSLEKSDGSEGFHQIDETGVDVVHGGTDTTLSSIDAGQSSGCGMGQKEFAHSMKVLGAGQKVHAAIAKTLTMLALMEIKKSAAKAKARIKWMKTEQIAENGSTGEKCSEEDLPMKLVELLNQRKKFFAQQRGKLKRNKLNDILLIERTIVKFIKNQEVQYFVPMGSKLEVQRLKRAGQEVLEKPVKRQKIGEASGLGEESAKKEKELLEEELHKLLEILQKLSDFAKMLKKFIRGDLVKLGDFVKKRSLQQATDYDKEKE
ncbi:hypothetical protein Tco_0564489 [Tanacetum coccineum]